MIKKSNSTVMLLLSISMLIMCISFLGINRSRVSRANSERLQKSYKFGKELRDTVKAELSTGIIRDTLFLNICFSDSPESFNSKIISLAMANEIHADTIGKFIKYVFLTDSVFKNFSVTLKPVFQNNNLSELTFGFSPTPKNILENHYTTINQVKELLEKKFGAYSNSDTTSIMTATPTYRYCWIQGNLKIYLRGVKQDAGRPDVILVSFSDTRKLKHNIE